MTHRFDPRPAPRPTLQSSKLPHRLARFWSALEYLAPIAVIVAAVAAVVMLKATEYVR